MTSCCAAPVGKLFAQAAQHYLVAGVAGLHRGSGRVVGYPDTILGLAFLPSGA